MPKLLCPTTMLVDSDSECIGKRETTGRNLAARNSGALNVTITARMERKLVSGCDMKLSSHL